MAEGQNKQNPESAHWADLRLGAPDSGQGRDLARGLKKAGAAHVWQREGEVWSLWPDYAAAVRWAKSYPLARIAPAPAPDPKQAWRAPVVNPVSPRLSLAGPGMEPGREGPGRPMIIDPLTAFGAGDHPSTILNLRLLDMVLTPEWVRAAGEAWAADVGAGTGVLSLAIAALSKLKVAAVDPETASQRATARNLCLNPALAERVFFVKGFHSVLSGPFKLMAANLPGPLLVAVLPHLAACLAGGAPLTLSGFRNEFAPRVEAACRELGMTRTGEAELYGWTGLALVFRA